MKDYSQQFIKSWAKTRSIGRTKYIWLYGVVAFGVPAGIVAAFVAAWGKPAEELYSTMRINLIMFPIGGYWYGAHMWKTWEAKYSDYRQKLRESGDSDRSR